MDIEDDNTLIARAPEGSNTFKNSQHGCGKQTHKFTFSKIFQQTTSQKQFFDETVLSTVKDFIDGQNCLVFTYGVTNSGKTYTIQGRPLCSILLIGILCNCENVWNSCPLSF